VWTGRQSCQSTDNDGFAETYYIGNRCVQPGGGFYTVSGII
jgi:hypothetical protein